jgi:hypothetical protein
MTPYGLKKLVEARMEKALNTFNAKQSVYATPDDALHNFTSIANRRGVTRAQAMRGMYDKHEGVVDDMIDGTTPITEDLIDEFVGDRLVYTLLLEAALLEQCVRESPVEPFTPKEVFRDLRYRNTTFLLETNKAGNWLYAIYYSDGSVEGPGKPLVNVQSALTKVYEAIDRWYVEREDRCPARPVVENTPAGVKVEYVEDFVENTPAGVKVEYVEDFKDGQIRIHESEPGNWEFHIYSRMGMCMMPRRGPRGLRVPSISVLRPTLISRPPVRASFALAREAAWQFIDEGRHKR